MAFGKAASELVVAKAIETGSFTASINFLTGIFKNIITGTNTNNKNKSNAKYNDPNNINRFLRISTPKWPTVYAIGAPTPIGAKYIMMLVNLNMVSDKLSVKSTKGFLF